jgi:hypothetical protein
MDFNNGLARVGLGSSFTGAFTGGLKFGYVNTEGKYVWNPNK